jgi:hypothetical protein
VLGLRGVEDVVAAIDIEIGRYEKVRGDGKAAVREVTKVVK